MSKYIKKQKFTSITNASNKATPKYITIRMNGDYMDIKVERHIKTLRRTISKKEIRKTI